MENKIMTEIIPKLVEIELEKNNLLEKFNNEIHIEFVEEKIDGRVEYEEKSSFDYRMHTETYSISIFGQEVDTLTLSYEGNRHYPNFESGKELYEYRKHKWYKIISSIFSSEKLSKKMFKKFNIKKDDFYLNGEIDINNLYTMKEMQKLLDTNLSNIQYLESQKRKKTIEFNNYIKETDEKISKAKADIEKYKVLVEQREKEIEETEKKQKQIEIENISSSINNINLSKYSLDDLRKLTSVITDVINPKGIEETENLSKKI